MPNDLATLAGVARRHGAFVVDDAAQAMGAARRRPARRHLGRRRAVQPRQGQERVGDRRRADRHAATPDIAAALDEDVAALPSPRLGARRAEASPRRSPTRAAAAVRSTGCPRRCRGLQLGETQSHAPSFPSSAAAGRWRRSRSSDAARASMRSRARAPGQRGAASRRGPRGARRGMRDASRRIRGAGPGRTCACRCWPTRRRAARPGSPR